ncbi:MAG: DUF881 domain-containing protein [Selenomonadaceae bacterium]|nr:DUF881 domain-containing protein [Selenomonadaceae bacterium]
MEKFLQKGWSITLLCVIIGLALALEIRYESETSMQIEKLSARISMLEKVQPSPPEISPAFVTELKLQAGLLPLEGQGVIVTLDDSTRKVRAEENPNLYVIHDDDILRVINELRAAGAEAISINGQRLIATSEIRCAGPTLSVNNVRSAPPYEISAIGDKKSLENSIKMRGGVEETLKVWGIRLEIESSDEVYIPAYSGAFRHVYSKVAEEREL